MIRCALIVVASDRPAIAECLKLKTDYSMTTVSGFPGVASGPALESHAVARDDNQC